MPSPSKVQRKPTKKTTKERVYLTEEEKKVLQSQLDEWVSKPDKTSRDAFISSEVLPKIQQLNPDKYGPDIVSRNKEHKILWERRAEAVHTWLKNHKPFKDRAVFKLERKLSLRQVVARLRAEQIDQLILDKDPDMRRGDKAYPGLFQQALTECINGLGADTLEELEETRKEWQEIGPPMDVRLKAAKRYSRKGISNAHQILYKQMFVSCITFSFFPHPDTGVVGIVGHDYIADLHLQSHGKKFKTFKEWNSKAYERVVADLIGYADYVSNERDNVEESLSAPSPVTLNTGPGLLPLLPPPVKGVRGSETAKQAQEIVRAYFLRHYQMATGSNDVHTPWAQIGLRPSDFFDEACIPVGFKFQDPSRMGMSVKGLIDHLRARQEEFGVNAFHFHHIMRNQKMERAQYQAEASKEINGGDKSCWPIESAPGPDAECHTRQDEGDPIPKTEAFEVSNTVSIDLEKTIGYTREPSMDPFIAVLPRPEESAELGVSLKGAGGGGDKTSNVGVESDGPAGHLDIRPQYRDDFHPYRGTRPSFNFPTEPVDHTLTSLAARGPTWMTGRPSMPSWPTHPAQAPTINSTGLQYQGLPGPMGPLMAVFHPQYGYQYVPVEPHPSCPPPPSVPMAILDPQLQVPPGEPTFSTAHKDPEFRQQPELPLLMPRHPERIVIEPPTYTPTKSSRHRTTPLKRKRNEKDGDVKTPKTRSGRVVKTPTKLLHQCT